MVKKIKSERVSQCTGCPRPYKHKGWISPPGWKSTPFSIVFQKGGDIPPYRVREERGGDITTPSFTNNTILDDTKCFVVDLE